MFLLEKLGKVLARPARDPAVGKLYRACIAQSRHEIFYRAFGVPDSVDGRFDLLLLHVILVMRRLGAASPARQDLFDLMFADMDRNLREMGVGDMSVGKKIKPMLAAFYGRFQAYDKALGADGAALQAALKRNLYNNQDIAPPVLAAMAAYVTQVAATLGGMAAAALDAGDCHFPEPLAA